MNIVLVTAKRLGRPGGLYEVGSAWFEHLTEIFVRVARWGGTQIAAKNIPLLVSAHGIDEPFGLGVLGDRVSKAVSITSGGRSNSDLAAIGQIDGGFNVGPIVVGNGIAGRRLAEPFGPGCGDWVLAQDGTRQRNSRAVGSLVGHIFIMGMVSQ